MKVNWEHIRQRLRRSGYILAPLSILFIFFVSLYFLSFHEVSLAVDGQRLKLVTRATTIGELLKSEGVAFSARDLVSPAPPSPLIQGQSVTVRHAYPVVLTLDYETDIIWTLSGSVKEVLAEHGISAKTEMRVDKSLADGISPGTRIQVAFLKHRVETVDEEIPYSTKKVDDANLVKGKTKVRTAGQKGIRRKTVDHILAAGREISAKIIKDEVAAAPREEVIAMGTKLPQMVVRGPAAAPLISRGGRAIMMVATGYAANTGGAGSRTATGTGVYRGVVAVDPRVIPLGTRLYIDGYGEAIAADTGGAIRGNRIDLGFGSGAEALGWGRRSVTVHFL